MPYPFNQNNKIEDENDKKALEMFAFDGDDEPEEQSEYTGFIVGSLPEADKVIKKIVATQEYIKLKTEEAAEMKKEPLKEINRVDEWLKKETTKAQQNIDSLSARLMPFVAEQIEGKKKRSITLPSGRAGFTKGTTTFYYGNDQASKDNQQLLEYLIDNNYTEYVKTEILESVDWASLKKSLKVTDEGNVVISDTGELVELMYAEQAPDKFSVLPPKE